MILPIKLSQHFHLLVLGVALATASSTARAQAALMPCCNLLQGVNLVPCLAMASNGAAGGVVNISAACCLSLNQALDAGRRCLCSVLLSNSVLAGLVATLIPTFPLVLPLPGCYLFAPPLAACQLTVLQTTTGALPAAASAAATMDGAAAAGAVDPPPPQAAVTPQSKQSAAGSNAHESAASNGSSEKGVSHSDTCRHPGVGEGRRYMLTFGVVMAVFLLNSIHDFTPLMIQLG